MARPELKRMFPRSPMGNVIAEIEHSRDVAETNAPINERDGNIEQAKLERETARQCVAAIKKLQK